MKQWWWGPIAASLAAALPAGAMALGGLFVPTAGSSATTGSHIPGSAHRLARNLANRNWHQVSIEQHVIIRITPGNPAVLHDMPPTAPQPLPERLRERRMPPCVPVTALAGVRPLATNRLLLFLRDHRLVGADLARNCAARDFYLGFYITPTGDGQLCAGRDTIHSRAGTTCMITKMLELVPNN
jgi:hypothetical protein